ncbi:hypothetical protein QVA66_10055 [Staphylococcus chromogenes]|nr:hypothetical protein [Staphylococcus chromogenes]
MGRFTKMVAAPTPESAPRLDVSKNATDVDSLTDHGIQYARRRPVITDHERFDRLCNFSINQPNAQLATDAIKQAATVWCLTEKKSDKRDADGVKFLATYLYKESLYWGQIDPRRALQRATAESWLASQSFAPTSARTYKAVLHTAGRVLYPAEFPPANRYSNPRAKPVDPASVELIDELYGIAATLPDVHRLRLQLILDLTTQAGLRSAEVLDLRGSDVTARILDAGERIALVRVHRRGKVDRVLPVISPARSKRLLDHAKTVGRGHFFPSPSGGRPYNSSVANVFQYLRERGFPSTTVEALRARWLVDLANSPLPAAVVFQLAGNSHYRSLATHHDHLMSMEPKGVAELMVRARRLA